MSSLNELIARDPIRAAVWGVSGSAKTTLAALAAKFEQLRPIYFFDWDRRLATLRAVIPKDLWPYIHGDPYSDGQYQGQAWTKFEDKVARIESEGYKTVVLDTMTFMLEGVMARVLMLDGNKPATFNPQLQHYLSQQSMVKDILQKLCSKKFNFICCFHEGTDKDEISGRMFKAFAITGKLVERVPGYFNEIWHCEVAQASTGESVYTVRTRSDYTYMARTSFKTLKSVERQEDLWPKIVAEIQGNQESSSSPPQGPIVSSSSPTATAPIVPKP